MQHKRNRITKLGFAAIFLAASAVSWPEAKADGPNSAAVWAGIGFQKDAFAGFAGGIWAFSGDLGTSGVQFRGEVLYVGYDFKTGLVPSGKADGDLYRGNASIGYQWAGDGIAASLFGGIDLQDRDISPSAADNGKLDDDVGFLVTGRIATNGHTQFPASLDGKYSTANDDYWAQARVGYNLDVITIGPEVAALGNDDFNAIRFGGYASFNLGSALFEVNAGYNDSKKAGSSTISPKDSMYGGASVVLLF